MKLENQVVCRELSEKIKELGVKQESSWWWVKDKESKRILIVEDDKMYQFKEEESVFLQDQEGTVLRKWEELLDEKPFYTSTPTPRKVRNFLIKEKMFSPKMMRLLKSVKFYEGAYGCEGSYSASIRWGYRELDENDEHYFFYSAFTIAELLEFLSDGEIIKYVTENDNWDGSDYIKLFRNPNNLAKCLIWLKE